MDQSAGSSALLRRQLVAALEPPGRMTVARRSGQVQASRRRDVLLFKETDSGQRWVSNRITRTGRGTMTGTRQILFIQGGGADTHDGWDDQLVDSLRRGLGEG